MANRLKKEIYYNNLVYSDITKKLSSEKKLIIDYIQNDLTILEIGCNTGTFTKLLIEKKCRVTCLEIDPYAAAKAKIINDNIVIGDIEDDFTFSSIAGTFDIILLMHVLEHMIDPWKVLKKLKQKLNKDGYILVLLPSIAFWGFRKNFFLNGGFTYTDTGILDKTHLRFFNYHTARKLLTDSGYIIVDEKIPNYSIPISVRIRKIPLLLHLEKYWNKWMLKRFPNLVGEIFLFKAIPEEND